MKRVKPLGALCVLDEGETDWKIIAIDVRDPLASKLDDIGDVDTHMPGLLNSTKEWFSIYKVPAGKKRNPIAFDGQYKGAKYEFQVFGLSLQFSKHYPLLGKPLSLYKNVMKHGRD